MNKLNWNFLSSPNLLLSSQSRTKYKGETLLNTLHREIFFFFFWWDINQQSNYQHEEEIQKETQQQENKTWRRKSDAQCPLWLESRWESFLVYIPNRITLQHCFKIQIILSKLRCSVSFQSRKATEKTVVEALDKDSESWSCIQEKVKGGKTSGRARAAGSREKLEKWWDVAFSCAFLRRNVYFYHTSA